MLNCDCLKVLSKLVIDNTITSFDSIDFLAGQVILVDKPLGWTSFDVVNKLRFMLKKQLNVKNIKVGHAGTLDPLATGLVVVCTGKATKTIDSLLGQQKRYVAQLKFGETTPSFDAETEVDGVYDYQSITLESLTDVLKNHFTGEIQQIPPSYSAKSVDGKRAYKMARKGQEVIIPAQTVTIHSVAVTRFDLPIAEIDVTCSKGTYIRALANDIGKKLNSGAYLVGLHRTESGNFSSKNALTIEDFQEKLRQKAI